MKRTSQRGASVRTREESRDSVFSTYLVDLVVGALKIPKLSFSLLGPRHLLGLLGPVITETMIGSPSSRIGRLGWEHSRSKPPFRRSKLLLGHVACCGNGGCGRRMKHR